MPPRRSSESVGEPVTLKSPPDFARIYETYHDKIVGYVAKLIGRDDADDVAHEIFLKIARSRGTLEDPSRLTQWIYAVTLNAVRDAARARSARLSHIDEGDGSGDPLSDIADSRARSPEESAIRDEMVACYAEYVKGLPPDYLEVFVLSEFEHLANAEIARRLHVPLGTVKIRLHRARAKLHEELRRHCQCYTNERGELMGEPKR